MGTSVIPKLLFFRIYHQFTFKIKCFFYVFYYLSINFLSFLPSSSSFHLIDCCYQITSFTLYNIVWSRSNIVRYSDMVRYGIRYSFDRVPIWYGIPISTPARTSIGQTGQHFAYGLFGVLITICWKTNNIFEL